MELNRRNGNAFAGSFFAGAEDAQRYCRQMCIRDREKLRSEIAEWSEQEEDVLSYAQFPKVALDFFKKRRDAEYGINSALSNAEKQVHPV